MRTPLHGTYRGYDLITMPPPTSGGVTMLEMLNILERFDLAKLGDMSPAALHVEIEAMRRGYLDRARYLGDPDFVKMPVARLTSKTYAKIARGVDRSGACLEQRGARARHRDAGRVHGGRRDDAVLDRRPRGQRRVEHVHARGRLRVARRRRRRRIHPQQRDGRLQQEAGRDESHWRHRHAGESHRAGQAHAQLDEPHDRHEERQAVHGDGLARAGARSSIR